MTRNDLSWIMFMKKIEVPEEDIEDAYTGIQR